MAENSADIGTGNKESPHKLERPNITDPEALDKWINRYVDTPFAGTVDRRHPNSKKFSRQERIEATRNQFRVYPELVATGKYSVDEVTDLLVQHVEVLRSLKDKDLLEKIRLLFSRNLPTLRRR